MTEEQREAALRDIRGPDPVAIVEAAKLLSADSSTTARLLELLASEERVEVRQGILYALTWHGDVSLWDLMIRILSDQKEHPKVRGQAAECISYMFDKKEGSSQRPHGIPKDREPADVLDAVRAEVHARSEGKLFNLLMEFVFGLRGYDEFPEDAFERFTSLLADPAFWKHEDIWPFLREIGDRWTLLSSSQREQLRPLLIANFDKGSNPVGAFVIGELLGGRYGDEAALDALSSLAGVASMPARAFVPHGLGVLARETRNGKLRKRAVLVLRHLEKSEIEEVRSEAGLALRKIGIPEVHE
ncbi:hypothetical protein [Cystobacter fuscus]|uniref:hypothetical protein n=1 Tax=Cystobacter fuscus TaxID=43 RepID=UPI0012FD0FF9|nr:hypothetical protein [Cystobacter fuscus]